MAEATWGTVTAKSGGGSSDPNILSLKEATRIRLVSPGAVRWRQHFVESTKDSNQGRSVVCPKGPDGRDSGSCPLCMKPVGPDGKTQLFPVSRRSATNVWDYESGGVKVLIGGPQIFEEFDAAAQVGMNPMEADYIIHRMGEGKQTSYKLIRGNSEPLATQITPDMLHDLAKYDTPTSTERIFEILDEMGWDYDALETPSFTLEEAEAFVMPYTKKHKGETIEQIVASDQGFAEWLHGQKKDQGAHGDPVFLALQVVLEARGIVSPLEGMPTAPPRPATASAPSAPAPTAPDTVELVNAAGKRVTVPAAAREAMLGAGFTEPEPEPEPVGQRTLIAPDGQKVDASALPEAAVSAMLAAGYTLEEAAASEPEVVPADDDVVTVSVAGTRAQMRYADARALIASGAASLVQDEPAPAEPLFQLPGDDESVEVVIGGSTVPMAFGTAKATVATGAASFVDGRIAAALDDDGAAKEQAQAAAASDPTPAGGAAGASLDPALTGQREDGRWTHPALDKDYATKGAVTQALKRLVKDGPAEAAPAAPAATQSAPAASAPAAATSAPASGKDALMEKARTLMASMPELTKDFKVLLELFQRVAGKRNITDFDESELQKLIVELEGMKAV